MMLTRWAVLSTRRASALPSTLWNWKTRVHPASRRMSLASGFSTPAAMGTRGAASRAEKTMLVQRMSVSSTTSMAAASARSLA